MWEQIGPLRKGRAFFLFVLLCARLGVHAQISSQPLPSSVRAKPGETLFEEMPAGHTGLQFQLRLPAVEKNIHEIIHLSVYGGLCAGDFDGDGRADLFVTSPVGGCRLFRNRGDCQFEDVATFPRDEFWATGASFVDIDNDGDLDLYVCAYNAANRLYLNDGAGRFTERAKEFGLDYRGASMMMAFADLDNDGDLDGYLATTALPPPPGVRFRYLTENGKQAIPKELQEYWGLVHLPNGQAHPTEAGQFDHLFRNDGGKFTEISKQAGLDGAYFTLAAIWCDFNADGWPDLYVANDYLGPDILYQNRGDGTFTNVLHKTLSHTPYSSMGLDVADLNNDGLIDLMATDMLGSTDYRRKVMAGETSKTSWFMDVAEPRQYNRNAVYLNSGAGPFLEAAWQTGLAATDWTWGPRLEDFDNDGRVDVFIANGMLRDIQNADLGLFADRTFRGGSAAWAKFWADQAMQKEANFAFRNRGDLRFDDVSAAWGLGRVGVSLGVATADFDNDGALDLAVLNADAPVSIYRNRSTATNAIRVRLQGTKSNRHGIGASARLQAGDLAQTRYLALNRAWLSASEPILHFGLGNAERVEALEIKWPSGRVETFKNLAANRLYTIVETTNAPEKSIAPKTLFTPSTILSGLESVAASIDDFAIQPLLPKKLSGQQMPMAWGDLDKDGSQDLFLGHPSRLFLNPAEGFRLSAKLERGEVPQSAALFVDLNRDGNLDLIVVGNEDQVFLNDGQGALSLAYTNSLRGHSLAAMDFDRDGTVDIFIGGHATAAQFPRSAPSRLVNFRDGKWIDVTPPIFRRLALATAAVWADADKDGWPDLFVATEWGPIHYFRNDFGKLIDGAKDTELAERTGFWTALAAADVNHDGKIDLVAGNLGLNTAYRATLEQPALLFYGDVDGSGLTNILQAHFVGDLGFPDRGLDTLSQSMPNLRPRFPTFAQFAKAPIEKISAMERLRDSYRLEVNTLESGVFINEGRSGFKWAPLPPLAQLAPVRDLAVADLNDDGRLDVALAQNDFSPHREVGRMDGGVGLILTGDGRGAFQALWPTQSGVVAAGESRRVQIVDLNRDGRMDVFFGGSSSQTFVRRKVD